MMVFRSTIDIRDGFDITLKHRRILNCNQRTFPFRRFVYQGRCSAQCKECDKHEEGEESKSHIARSIATVSAATGNGSRCIIEWERDGRRFRSREHGGLKRLRQKGWVMWSMRA